MKKTCGYIYGIDLAEKGSKDYSCVVEAKKLKSGVIKIINIKYWKPIGKGRRGK